MTTKITFWGVRGSIACASPDYLEFGGNTVCIEADFGTRTVVLDAGTGIRFLSKRMKEQNVKAADLLISHTHWDHICGFPFFEQIFDKDFTLDVYGGTPEGRTVRQALHAEMSPPFFPVALHQAAASIRFHDLAEKESFALDDGNVRVSTAPLNHPNGATGYRLDGNGVSIAYISDTEHPCDKGVLRLVRDCDLMIYDATYTDEEYTSRVGWGHSTPGEALKIGKAANVRKIAFFHHSPDHTDAALTAIERDIRTENPDAFFAREGMTVVL